jgi:uncharacterized metal-binding protein
MFCLAGVGGRVDGIMKTTETAEKILAIDGCPLLCAKKTLESAGFSKFDHVLLADIGMVKGQTEPNEANISKAVEICAAKLA